MTTLEVLEQLQALGMMLTPHPDGTVHCRGPKGALSAELVAVMRAQKAEFHALVETWSERAALAEYCGGLSRADADRVAWAAVLAHGRKQGA